jgi:hypothetical protein
MFYRHNKTNSKPLPDDSKIKRETKKEKEKKVLDA